MFGGFTALDMAILGHTQQRPGQHKDVAMLLRSAGAVAPSTEPMSLINKRVQVEGIGRGQIIRKHPVSGVWWAGSDPRADGCAVGW